MEYAILKRDKTAHLHLLVDTQYIPLTPVPGHSDAKYIVSSDQSSFAFIDQAKKRIAFYKILVDPPYYETLISPTTLPRHCRADCLVIFQRTLYIGGTSRKGECLWLRKPHFDAWINVPLPPNFPTKNNKSIDELFIKDNLLIAIDNILLFFALS